MQQEAVALYLRLSREDEEKKFESESIKNQRDFLMEYALKRGWTVYDVYTDDGVSGTKFERPGFLKLIADIECGKINTVICKDLSRLGRDYIQTGFYLEKYFPSRGIRFIAVNDSIDTGNDDEGNNDMSPFRAVINDMYARDISKKIRTALTTKKKNGRFIGSFAPFGYMKDSMDKGHLIINEEAAPVVREIYRLCLEGNSIIAISKLLTQRNIPTPSMSKGNRPTQEHFAGLWNDTMIKRILTNETYIGNLTQNRSRKVGYKVDKKVNLDKKDWIVVEGTHEAIIDKEDFLAVQKILDSRTYIKRDSGTGVHLLSGLIYCGKCNSPMTFVREGQQRSYMVCSAWKKYGSLGLCTSHCIREDYVEGLILDVLRQFAQRVSIDGMVDKLLKESGKKSNAKSIADTFNQKSIFYKKAQADLYKDKIRGIVNEEMYVEMSKRFSEEYDEIKKLYEKNLNNRSELNKEDLILRRVTEFLKFEKIERSNLLLLIGKVKIFDGKKIEIIFNFNNPERSIN